MRLPLRRTIPKKNPRTSRAKKEKAVSDLNTPAPLIIIYIYVFHSVER